MKRVANLVAAAFVATSIAAGANDAAFIPLYDGPDGLTCRYYNLGGRVKWRERMGDWLDAAGERRGSREYARAEIADTDASRPIEFDLTKLARAWAAGEVRNTGIALATARAGARGIVHFHSREADDVRLRPVLRLELRDGTRRALQPVADVHADCSTVRGMGREKLLQAGPENVVYLRFELPAERIDIRRATLVLTTIQQQYGAATLGVYRIDAPAFAAPGRAAMGLARDYPFDAGIERDPDVLMASTFENGRWMLDWSSVRPGPSFESVERDDALRFEPLSGRALRVTVARGTNLGLDIGYALKNRDGVEPEAIYFRYYLRFADDFMSTVDGGKLPGLSGTYGRVGWGGRKWDGRGGWSMRGDFQRSTAPENPLHDFVAVGTYAYHAAQSDDFGDSWTWDEGLRGLLRRNRWYCIEQYFRVNTVGAEDGELKVWVDGEVALHRTGLRVRDIPEIRIEKVWMNVYHGGTARAPADMHLFIDNVVVARRYIGPMRTTR